MWNEGEEGAQKKVTWTKNKMEMRCGKKRRREKKVRHV